jgi:glycosyltransferase involved in cell wall biosynthesis
MRPTALQLSIVLPVYNERPALQPAIEAYRAALADSGIEDYEIILVDDGSSDGTGELAEAIAAADRRVRVLRHERNQGQVQAILNGFRAARGRVLTHNGIDLPFDPRDVPRALACFADGADVVVVERADRACYGLTRKVLSWANMLLLKVLLGTPFRDHNFVQFYRREVIAAAPVRSSGVNTVTPELILRALRHGFRVVSVAAQYHGRRTGQSTLTVQKVAHAVWQTQHLWWVLRSQRSEVRSQKSEVRSQESDNCF